MANNLKMETGRIAIENSIDGGFEYELNFVNEYSVPIVIAYVTTRNNEGSLQVRVKDVTDVGCSVFTQNGERETLALEEVSYLVVEAGTHELPDGSLVCAGYVDTDEVHRHGDSPAGEVVIYGREYQDKAPVVFTTLNTYNNEDYMASACHSMNTASVEVTQEAMNTGIAATRERIAWVAFPSRYRGIISESIKYETFNWDNEEDSNPAGAYNPHYVQYFLTYDTLPVILCSVQTYNTTDGSYVRGADFYTSEKHGVFIEEDRLNNGYAWERHDSEEIASVLFSDSFSVDYTDVNDYYGAPEITFGDRNISINSNFVFRPVYSGVEVYDLDTSLLGFVDLPGASFVYANDDYLYIGTTISGVYRSPMATISGGNYSTVQHYLYEPNLTSDTIRYLHGAGEYLCITTDLGVDHYNIVSGTRSYTETISAHRCYQTSSGRFYYISNEASDVNYYMANKGWSYVQLITISGTFPPGYQMNIELNPSNFNYANLALDNAGDLRFTDDYGYSLPHWIEDFNYNGITKLWVKIFRESTSYIKMFYGNIKVDVFGYDPQLVWDLYDNFDKSEFNYNRWEQILEGSSPSITLYDGYIKLEASDDEDCGLRSNELIYDLRTKMTANIKSDGEPGPNYNLDYILKYSDSSDVFYSYIGSGPVSGTEFAHSLRGPTTDIEGSVYMGTTYEENIVVNMEDYGSSTYSGESLTKNYNNSAIFIYKSRIEMYINNSGANDLYVDYIRVQKHSDSVGYAFDYVKNLTNIKERLIVIYDNVNNWTEDTVGYSYEDGTTYIRSQSRFNDIYVTEGTSTYSPNDNVLFLATSWGAVIIEERQGDESNSRQKKYLIRGV